MCVCVDHARTFVHSILDVQIWQHQNQSCQMDFLILFSRRVCPQNGVWPRWPFKDISKASIFVIKRRMGRKLKKRMEQTLLDLTSITLATFCDTFQCLSVYFLLCFLLLYPRFVVKRCKAEKSRSFLYYIFLQSCVLV